MVRQNIDVRESLRASFKDGIFAALMGGVTDHYATPLALFLGATVLQVGFVSALPNLLSSLSQFFAVRVIYRVGGRRKLLVRLVFSQASLFFGIAVLAASDVPSRVEWFLVLLTLAALCGGLPGPAWGSLMSDYIPARKRGQKRVRCIAYFNVINGVAVFLGSATGEWLASRLPPLFGYQLIGLFVLSGFCRLLVYISLSARFQEVRRAREVSIRELFFSVVGISPADGLGARVIQRMPALCVGRKALRGEV